MKRHPLDTALGTPAKVAVLRILCTTSVELTGRETARLAGVSVPQAIQALNELAQRRIVIRRQAGRAGLYAINEKLDLVRKGIFPLFKLETSLTDSALKTFSNSIGEAPLSLTLFGSRARRDSSDSSDVDLLVVMRHVDDKFRERILRLSLDLSSKIGLHVSPLILSLKECRAASGQKQKLMEEILREGQTVAGKPLMELLNAKNA